MKKNKYDLKIYFKIFNFLSKRRKFVILLFFLLSVIGAFTEVASVSLLIPFADLMIEPQKLNEYLLRLNIEINYDEETINYLARSFFMPLSGVDNGESGDELYDRIPGNLFYQIKNTASYDKDLTLDLLDNDGTFTSKIINYIKGFITYIYTDDEIDEIVSSDFINTNKKILEIMCKQKMHLTLT